VWYHSQNPSWYPPKSMMYVGIEQVFLWYHGHLSLLGTTKSMTYSHIRGNIAGFCYDVIKTGSDITKLDMLWPNVDLTKHLTSYVALDLLWGSRSTMAVAAAAAPLPCWPGPPALLSVCLFGSTTVVIPLCDMLQRGELTNVLEIRKCFKEEIL
jgi:hypothetical protein